MPAALGAWAAMGVATWGEGRLTAVLACVAVGITGVAAWRRAWVVVLSCVVVAACLVSGGLRVWVRDAHPVAEAARAKAVVVVDARVVGEPRVVAAKGHRPALRVVPVVVERSEARGGAWSGPVEATVIAAEGEAWRGAVVGARFSMTGRAGPVDRGERGVAILKPMGEPRLLAAPPAGLAFVERLRAGLRAACGPLWPEARALVPALVVGDVTGIDEGMTETFQTTGLTHLTAVSGSNLALLLVFVGTAAAWCGVRGWWLRGLGVATAVGFVFLCRAEPSVVRAAAMGLVTLAALGSGARGSRGLRHLAVAVLALLLLDPWLSRSLGFALSVLASAGIICLGRRWTESLWWAPRWVAESVAVPLAAQVATQTVVTGISGQVTVTGLAANAVAGPLVGPATIAGLVATLLCWCPPLATAAAFVAGMFATGIVWVARLGAAAPGAAWSWPATPVALGVVALACVVLVVVMPSVLGRRWACAVVGLALAVLGLRVPTQPGWPPPDWLVVECDVGQGDATVINAGGGAAVVVDVGPDAALLRRCLAQLGVSSVPLLVLSHDHADHTGGLRGLTGLPVGVAMLSRTPSSNRPELLRELERQGVGVGLAEPGQRLAVGPVAWRTVAAPASAPPAGAAEGESSAENDGSIVATATVGGVTVLLTGDVEPLGQARALDQPDLLQAEILKVPHHGSGRQDPTFLAAVGARVALIGVGADNDYHHPAPKTVAALGTLDMHIGRTDRHGSVAVSRRGGELVVVRQRDG